MKGRRKLFSITLARQPSSDQRRRSFMLGEAFAAVESV
jgi:hypothetical protein